MAYLVENGCRLSLSTCHVVGYRCQAKRLVDVDRDSIVTVAIDSIQHSHHISAMPKDVPEKNVLCSCAGERLRFLDGESTTGCESDE